MYKHIVSLCYMPSNQSILKEISPGCSLEGLIKLKLQYFGHLMERVNSSEKTLMLGGIGGRRRRDNRGWDGWMASQTWWTWFWVTPGVGDGQGGLACCDSWGHIELDTTEQLNWTELNNRSFVLLCAEHNWSQELNKNWSIYLVHILEYL